MTKSSAYEMTCARYVAFPSGLSPIPQEAIHVGVGQRRADHPALRSTTAAVPAAAHASLPITIPFFDWRLEPHFDEAQDVSIDDAPGNRLQQFSVRDRVKVFGQIGVYHVCVAAAEKRMHFLDCIRPAWSGGLPPNRSLRHSRSVLLRSHIGEDIFPRRQLHGVPLRRQLATELMGATHAGRDRVNAAMFPAACAGATPPHHSGPAPTRLQLFFPRSNPRTAMPRSSLPLRSRDHSTQPIQPEEEGRATL